MNEKPSFLENLSDRVLKSFLNKLNESGPWSEIDTEFIDKCDFLVKLTGNSDQAEVSDISFLYNLMNLNKNIQIDEPLNRPSRHVFEVDWYNYETRWVRETYTHEILSYSDNGTDVSELINKLRMVGELDPWDGEFVSDKLIDMETTDDRIAHIEKIK